MHCTLAFMSQLQTCMGMHAEFDYNLYGLNYPADVSRDIYSPLQLHYGKEVG